MGKGYLLFRGKYFIFSYTHLQKKSPAGLHCISFRIKSRHTQDSHSKLNSGGRPKKQSLPYLRPPSEKEKQASSWQQSKCKERPLQQGATCTAYQHLMGSCKLSAWETLSPEHRGHELSDRKGSWDICSVWNLGPHSIDQLLSNTQRAEITKTKFTVLRNCNNSELRKSDR